MNPAVRESVGRGVAYVANAQRSDGGFDSLSSAIEHSFRPDYTYRNTFTPALMLGALAKIPQAEPVCTALAAWLLAQKSPQWSFNYWAADAPERQAMPYPDDLDDTFCALSGLYQHNPKHIDASALGMIVRLLLAAERRVGGPYRTWLVPRTAPAVWQDVDVAVNCNIAFFLRLVARPLPNLTTHMEAAITSKALMSPYYPNVYPLWYFLARAYQGPLTAKLQATIMHHREQGHWGTPLQTALALTALHRLGSTAPQDAAIGYLLASQSADGSWPAEAFFTDPARNGAQYVGGSAALTTAFVLEALHCINQKDKPVEQPDTDRAVHALYETVVAQANAEFAALPSGLALPADTVLKHMLRHTYTREIILLPLFFARSLSIADAPPQRILARLGLANLYGWTAYTIYDDLLDANGDTRLLPVANAAHRLSFSHFTKILPRRAAFHTFVRDVFNRIDAANAWEATNCRFIVHDGLITIAQLPRFGNLSQLAERSLGHALPAMGVLAAVGIPPKDPRAQQLLEALKHYLIARQLGDDLRDWEADLRAGTCSYVVAAMLSAIEAALGGHQLSELVPRLRREFAEHTLHDVSHTILRHTAQAHRALKRSGSITPGSTVQRLIDDLEELARRQLSEQADTQAFLDAYGQKPPRA